MGPDAKFSYPQLSDSGQQDAVGHMLLLCCQRTAWRIAAITLSLQMALTLY